MPDESDGDAVTNAATAAIAAYAGATFRSPKIFSRVLLIIFCPNSTRGLMSRIFETLRGWKPTPGMDFAPLPTRCSGLAASTKEDFTKYGVKVMATKRQTVVGIFKDHQQAQTAVNELKRAGFTDAQIGVAGRNYDGASGTLTRDGDDQDSYAGEGAAAGLAAGAGVGALWGLGILSGVLPVIGPAIAGGTLGIILSSAAAGAAAAGLTGALVGMGIPKDEAEFYESEFRSGRTIVTVACNGRESEATSLLRRFGGYDISSRGESTGTTTSSTMDKTTMGKSKAFSSDSTRRSTTSAHGDECVTAHEEQLHVRKQPVETGEVKVRKEVHTEHKTIDVPVEREEVVIERRPAGGQPTREGIHAGEEIRVPIREEQVKVEKQTVAKEQVSIGKRKVQETERVEGDVRKEDIKVETEGNARVRDNRGKK